MKNEEAKRVYDSVKSSYHTWSVEEDKKLCMLIRIHGLDYPLIARDLPMVSSEQVCPCVLTELQLARSQDMYDITEAKTWSLSALFNIM